MMENMTTDMTYEVTTETSNVHLIGSKLGVLDSVEDGCGEGWYPEKEKVIPRVYHKYLSSYEDRNPEEEDDTPTENAPEGETKS